MFPTPKNNCIRFNNAISLPCNSIAKIGLTLHPDARSLLLMIEIINEDSASENPVTQKGFRGQTGLSRPAESARAELDEYLTGIERRVLLVTIEKERQSPNNEPTITESTSELWGPIREAAFI